MSWAGDFLGNNAAYHGNTAEGTLSVTLASGSDRYLIAGAKSRQSTTLSGMTYGGVAVADDLGFASSATGGVSTRGYMRGLANPATGPNDLIVTMSGSNRLHTAAFGVSGIDGTTKHRTPATSATNSTVTTRTVTGIGCVVGDLVVDLATTGTGASPYSPIAALSPQVERTTTTSGTFAERHGMSSLVAASTSESMGWEMTEAGAGGSHWANMAVALIPAAAGDPVIAPGSLLTAEAFGTAAVATDAAVVSPASLLTAEAFGAVTLALGAVALAPASLLTAEAFGAALVATDAPTIFPGSLLTAELFGTAALATGTVTLEPASLLSAEAFGSTLVVTGLVAIAPEALASSEAFGTAVLEVGAVAIEPSGLATVEAFGSATIEAPLDVNVSPSSLLTAEAFGTLQAGQDVTLEIDSLLTAEAFGTASLFSGLQTIAIPGLEVIERFGRVVMLGGRPAGYLVGDVGVLGIYGARIHIDAGLSAEIEFTALDGRPKLNG